MSQSEGYPPEWKKLVLMVSPKGTFHAIGGDLPEGHDGGEACYPGMDFLRDGINRIALAAAETVAATVQKNEVPK